MIHMKRVSVYSFLSQVQERQAVQPRAKRKVMCVCVLRAGARSPL